MTILVTYNSINYSYIIESLTKVINNMEKFIKVDEEEKKKFKEVNKKEKEKEREREINKNKITYSSKAENINSTTLIDDYSNKETNNDAKTPTKLIQRQKSKGNLYVNINTNSSNTNYNNNNSINYTEKDEEIITNIKTMKLNSSVNSHSNHNSNKNTITNEKSPSKHHNFKQKVEETLTIEKKYSDFFDIGRSADFLGAKTELVFPDSHFIGKNLWLVKASNLNRGRGIKLCDGIKTITRCISKFDSGICLNFKESEIHDNDIYNSSSTNMSTVDYKSLSKKGKNMYKSSLVVIQKYIEKPFLYKNRKFDIRVWVLLTHKMEVYVFK